MIALRSAVSQARPQRGLALLMMLVLLVLGSLYLFVDQLTAAGSQAERDEITDAALAQAKEALIAYALTYGDTHPNKLPGYLLCPDTGRSAIATPEGSADLACGTKNTSVIGRFPWRTLGLPPLRDGSTECLWYAVSGSFKNNPPTDMMNWDTNGQLAVKGADGSSFLAGASPDGPAAAVIFAPGPPTGGQDRRSAARAATCGGNYDAGNYLESSGGADNSAVSAIAGAVSTFIVGGRLNGVNDRLLAISPNDIFDAIQKRSDFNSTVRERSQRVANCVAAYGARNAAGASDKRLPWPAPVELADYAAAASYDDGAHILSGRLPYRVNNSKRTTANVMSQTDLVTGVNCPGPWSALDDDWYGNWKDHLFYSLADSFSPSAATPSDCANCLSANGSGAYAAIVMFAGRRLAGQARSTPAEKALIANYLEGSNSANHPNAGGNADYRSAAATTSFNDILYCIDASLTVKPCP